MEKRTGTDVNQVHITSLNHIKGQSQVVDVLRVHLDAYFNTRAMGKPSTFGPILMLGPSGSGKTLTSKALHCELANLNLVESNGESLKATDLYQVLINANEETTIFVDEAQALDKKVQHILLTAISEKKIFVPRRGSSGKFAIPLANFTLILASTHEFQLQDALRNRMRVICRFNYYSIDDLTYIIKQRTDALGWKYESQDILTEIAKRSKKTPRIALNRILQMSYNVASSNNREVITLEDTLQAFRLIDIDELGLDTIERKYLNELAKRDSMKLNVLASKLGLPRATVSAVIEPYLLQTDLIEKVGSDRCITALGLEHIKSTEYKL